MKLLLFCFLLASNIAFGGPEEAATYVTKQYKRKFETGLMRNAKAHKEFLEKYSTKAAPRMRAVSIPGRTDLSRLVSPPEDQGNCGSCWSFGLTKALRSALMLAAKDPGTLAFNYLVNNCGKGSQTHMWGCQGGDFIAGEAFLNGEGPWLESQDHYTQKDHGRCLGLSPAGTALTFKTVGGTNPSFQELAQAVSDKHMLVIDVAATGSWMNYHGGIYNGNGSGINHMINMVGYDCETSVDASGNCTFDTQGRPSKGDGFLIGMNNWGTSWGEAGYIRTRWGRNQFAETAMYFEVKVVPPVPQGKDFAIETEVASVKGTVAVKYVPFYDNIVKVITEFLNAFKE